jgi:hypothetical protein
MNFEQAVEIVQQYRQDWALPSLLETLEQMQDCEDDLSSLEARAYRKVMLEMSKLFAAA